MNGAPSKASKLLLKLLMEGKVNSDRAQPHALVIVLRKGQREDNRESVRLLVEVRNEQDEKLSTVIDTDGILFGSRVTVCDIERTFTFNVSD